MTALQNYSLSRYLLCRPLGGLNDTLTQISRCLKYAREHGRQLIVDTASNPKIGADLSRYFDSSDLIRFESGLALEFLNSVTCFPGSLQGNINGYICTSLDSSPVREAASHQAITFDFLSEYSETLLVHQQFGGGLNSIDLCGELEMRQDIWLEVLRRKSSLRPDYSAVHVRQSDYETNWMPQLESLKNSLSKSTVLIASDNPGLVDQARVEFGDLEFVGTETKPVAAPLDKTAQALVDLALLAEANELFVLKLTGANVTYSGFSMLAKYIWTVRKVRKSGLFGLLFSRSLFLDFHTSKSRTMRLIFFTFYFLPRIIRHSRGADLLPRCPQF